jgi:D-alanyl-lipoteichoic acid acyltransferase DltB (MBOAT superfamily)
MVFTSFEFILFFAVFFILYWFVANKNLKLQNLLILIAGYLFYARLDWHFLSYLIGVSALNFLIGIYIEKASNPTHKRLLLYIGLLQGIGGLVFFKYFNFFITSFNDVLHSLGINQDLHTLNIIIPLGISFFTFKTISYVLDIYNEKINAAKDWIVFFNYISFFPTIISGPIDRPNTLIPQFEKEKVFDYNKATDALRQILWGLFKKVVIANNCAPITNEIFDHYNIYPGSTLLIGAFFYAIELYADFSGYSDMAIGIGRLIGFNITRNFDYPYFAQNIAEFWRKWHMSLTSWFTEYVFTPLSFLFRGLGKAGLFFAILINYIIVGLWHGANWTYVVYGFLHGCFFIPLILRGTVNKKKNIVKNKLVPSFAEFINMLGTFTVVMLSMIVFRSGSIQQAYHYYNNLFSLSIFSKPFILNNSLPVISLLVFILFMFCFEWIQRTKRHALQFSPAGNFKFYAIALLHSILIWSIILWGFSGDKTFIYAKF